MVLNAGSRCCSGGVPWHALADDVVGGLFLSLSRIFNDLELPVCLLSTLSNNPHGRF